MLAEARIDVAGRSLHLAIEAGEAVALQGPNGSGKTSILRALAGLDPGGVVAGRPTARLAAAELQRTVAYLPEEASDALVGLTVGGEARLRGRTATSLPEEQEISTLSTGEARALATSFVDGPLWLLDEPAAGLDAHALEDLRRRIAARGDAAVVFVDQEGRLTDLADRVVELAAGAGSVAPPMPPLGDVVATREAETWQGLALPALQLRRGVQAIAGRNGSGKSTLLRRAAGLEGHPLMIHGRPARLGHDVRLLLPDARDHLAGDSVRDLLRGCGDATVRAFVPEALLHRHPLTLSRGEAQRVALARTLGRPSPVVLLDEPFAHLDSQGRNALLAWLATADRAVLLAGEAPGIPVIATLGAP